MQQASIVYVHLGSNPAPTLISFANLAKNQLPNLNLYLITDIPNAWRNFPGTIINYNKKLRTYEFNKYAKKYRVYEKISSGYWLFTLERLFAMNVLNEYVTGPMIHLESDVYPIFSSELIGTLYKKVNKVAVPRYSERRGIASILYAKSLEHYLKMLDELLYILNSNKKFLSSDMDLLGDALNKKIIEELPTYPSDSWKIDINGKVRSIIFDAAALGQYLFGQDPFHTDNFRISGYKNPDFKIDIPTCKWNMYKNSTENTELYFDLDGAQFYPVNLHIHSKELLPTLDLKNKRWIRAIEEANGHAERIRSEKVFNTIHTKPIKFFTRLRLALRTGIVKALIRFLRNFKRI